MPVPGVPTSGSDYAYPSIMPRRDAPWPLREENPLPRPADPRSNLFQTLSHLRAGAVEKPDRHYHDIVINHLILPRGRSSIRYRLSLHIFLAKVYAVHSAGAL